MVQSARAHSGRYKRPESPRPKGPRANSSKVVSKPPRTFFNWTRVEKAALVLTAVLSVVVVSLIALTNGRIIDRTIEMLQSLESPDAQAMRNAPGLHCSDPRNRNTPYCVERQAKIEGEWHNLFISRGREKTAFTLHGGE